MGCRSAPGPLRAFFLRIQARRGQHLAAVATARKLAIVIWHLLTKDESYAWGAAITRLPAALLAAAEIAGSCGTGHFTKRVDTTEGAPSWHGFDTTSG